MNEKVKICEELTTFKLKNKKFERQLSCGDKERQAFQAEERIELMYLEKDKSFQCG